MRVVHCTGVRLSTCFPSGSLAFWECWEEAVRMTSPSKNQVLRLQGVDSTPHVVITHYWRSYPCLCDSPVEILGSLCQVPLDFTPWSFSLHWFFFVSFFTVTVSHEYDYMLSPVSCPSESLNVGVVWGILSTQSSLGKAPAAANARAGAGTFSSRILVMCFMCFFYCYYKGADKLGLLWIVMGVSAISCRVKSFQTILNQMEKVVLVKRTHIASQPLLSSSGIHSAWRTRLIAL